MTAIERTVPDHDPARCTPAHRVEVTECYQSLVNALSVDGRPAAAAPAAAADDADQSSPRQPETTPEAVRHEAVDDRIGTTLSVRQQMNSQLYTPHSVHTSF